MHHVILVLATVFTAIRQGDSLPQECRTQWYKIPDPHFSWDRYAVSEDCPLVKELKNPFQTTTQPSPHEICFCTKWGADSFECPKIDTTTNPNGYFSDFLFCLKNDADDGRYLLSIPGKYVTGYRYDCAGYRQKIFYKTPLLKYLSDSSIKHFQDPRCNQEIRTTLRDQKAALERKQQLLLRNVCSYRRKQGPKQGGHKHGRR